MMDFYVKLIGNYKLKKYNNIMFGLFNILSCCILDICIICYILRAPNHLRENVFED
jgi:CTP:phosphocholine cytidylyltransferase-like protein